MKKAIKNFSQKKKKKDKTSNGANAIVSVMSKRKNLHIKSLGKAIR